MISSAPAQCPMSSDYLWADDVLADPFEHYRRLRDLGPVVWLDDPGLLALTRFAEVRAALADWRTYSSADGVGIDDQANGSLFTSILTSDPPIHDGFRKPLTDQLSVAALADDTATVEAIADRFVDDVCRAGTFDAVSHLARPYSLAVVGDLVGLPLDGRDSYPGLAERAFNLFGPPDDRLADAMVALAELGEQTAAACPHLAVGGRGHQLFADGQAASVMAYTWPGIDTTVNAIGSAALLFAEHPDQWELVRSDRSLIPAAFSEVLRLHSPVQFFTRTTTGPVVIGAHPGEAVEIAAGTRVLIMYGSANRDERRYPDPDRFDVTRNPTDQLAFGRGVHLCVGINLARLEAHSLLDRLADRVERFEVVGAARWTINNTLHGLEQLPLRIVPTQ